MPVKKNLALAIMDNNRIDDVNRIISEYASITRKSSTHIIFDTLPVHPDDIAQDITFFRLECESESLMDEKLNDMIEELDSLNTDYTLRDEGAGEMIVSLDFVGMLKIKFDKLKMIKPGTYEKIDELKLSKTEFGYCKGYKPDFRPIESQTAENMRIEPEKIYLFSDSRENLSKLTDYLSEKVMEIDQDFEVEFVPFT